MDLMLLYRDNAIPDQTIWECHHDYLNSLTNLGTQKVYANSFEQLFKQNFLNPSTTLKEFSAQNLELILDNIRQYFTKKNGKLASEATRESRCAAFIGFTVWLARRSQGLVRKVMTNKEGSHKTFCHKKEHTVSTFLTKQQQLEFFSAIKDVSLVGYLCACLQFQGARRISEVLECLVEDVNWEEKKVVFKPKKTNHVDKLISIFYPQDLMLLLKEYVGERKTGYVFADEELVKEGKYDQHIKPSQMTSYYKKAWIKIAQDKNPGTTLEDDKVWLPKSLSHCLRGTAISSLCEKDVNPEKIRKITGHSRIEMISYYDKSGDVNNISRVINLLDFKQ